MKKSLLLLFSLLTVCSCNGQKETYYKVTWLNYDQTVLEVDENVKKGTIPSYDGKAPT